MCGLKKIWTKMSDGFKNLIERVAAGNFDAFTPNGENRSQTTNVPLPKPKPKKVDKGSTPSILDLIAKHESGGNYNVAWGGKEGNFTDMTLDQVMNWQANKLKQGSPSSAVGRYQFLKGTLEDLKKKTGLKGDEPFNEELQDRLAIELLKRRGYDKFKQGELSTDEFMVNLAKEWASLPKDRSGKSYYAGDGLNKALVNPKEVLRVLNKYRGV